MLDFHLSGQVLDQFNDGVLEGRSSGDWALGDVSDTLRSLWPHALDERIVTVVQEALEVLEQAVTVFVHESWHFVSDISSVVLDAEIAVEFQGFLRVVGLGRGGVG